VRAMRPDQAPEGQTEVQKESPWRARMRYAQIGAAAVGGGALLAVTGAHAIFGTPPSATSLHASIPHPCIAYTTLHLVLMSRRAAGQMVMFQVCM
jgi:hypothetical protein